MLSLSVCYFGKRVLLFHCFSIRNTKQFFIVDLKPNTCNFLLPNSHREATFDVVRFTPSISLQSFMFSFSTGLSSLTSKYIHTAVNNWRLSCGGTDENGVTGAYPQQNIFGTMPLRASEIAPLTKSTDTLSIFI